MDDSNCEKETLLSSSQGHLQPERPRQISRSERRRTLLLISCLFSTNLLSFLVGCSLDWTTLIWKDNSPSASKGNQEDLFSGIDRKNLYDTTFEPFSYVMSKYTAPAGGEVDVDAAWEALGATHEDFLIPPSQAEAFDLRPEHVLYTPETISHPPGIITEPGYPATFQAIHQIHCLNLIRKALWFNADYYRQEAKGSWGYNQTDADVQIHVGHCLDAMRQVVMCNADTDVVPLLWYSRHGRTISDFARRKQCRDFESVRVWSEKHQIKALEYAVFDTPPNVTLANIVGG